MRSLTRMSTNCVSHTVKPSEWPLANFLFTHRFALVWSAGANIRCLCALCEKSESIISRLRVFITFPRFPVSSAVVRVVVAVAYRKGYNAKVIILLCARLRMNSHVY